MNEAVRVIVYTRPHHQPVERREDARIDADAERQQENDHKSYARILHQHPYAITQVLKHLVLQSFWLQPQRVPERARTPPQQVKLGAPVEPIPLRQQLFAMTQLRLPLPPPIGPQAERHSHANDADQPEPETKSS